MEVGEAEGGGGAYSFLLSLVHQTVDHASLSKQGACLPLTVIGEGVV